MEPGVLGFDQHVVLRLEIILSKATFSSEALPAVSRLRLHSLNSAPCAFWEIVRRVSQYMMILFVLHFKIIVVLNVDDTAARFLRVQLSDDSVASSEAIDPYNAIPLARNL